METNLKDNLLDPQDPVDHLLPPPTQHQMEDDPADHVHPHPWDVPPQPLYATGKSLGTLVSIPEFPPGPPGETREAWKSRRRMTLQDWGKHREEFIHRAPKCLMDQLVSGSGLFPPRLLGSSWFTSQECETISKLEQKMHGTLRSSDIARDILALSLYDMDVSIVLDNSGSMQLDMFGQQVYGQQSPEDPRLLRQLLGTRQWPGRQAPPPVGPPPISPHNKRWFFAHDMLRRWGEVFSIMGLDPWIYLLNPRGHRVKCSQLESIFSSSPQGSTPMADALYNVLSRREKPIRKSLILVLTDGEANDMLAFNTILDSCQNGVYGDVQICLLGLSLKKEDIEFFENEECDETRIRTIEPYEVEARQIRLREVITRADGYNWEMHSYRGLVTNLFPADYDYEAPWQNLRHRFYITCHGRDRWWGINSSVYRCCCSGCCCTCCFLATCLHCCGWCQGNDCGKIQWPDSLAGGEG